MGDQGAQGRHDFDLDSQVVQESPSSETPVSEAKGNSNTSKPSEQAKGNPPLKRTHEMLEVEAETEGPGISAQPEPITALANSVTMENATPKTMEKEKRGGRRKINIEFIQNKNRRHVTFSKRKAGLIKKAYELSTLTGTQVLLLVASETGNVYTFATPKLQPLITKQDGKEMIQACLNPTDDRGPNGTPPQQYAMQLQQAHEVENFINTQPDTSNQTQHAIAPAPPPQSNPSLAQDQTTGQPHTHSRHQVASVPQYPGNFPPQSHQYPMGSFVNAAPNFQSSQRHPTTMGFTSFPMTQFQPKFGGPFVPPAPQRHNQPPDPPQ